MRVLTVSSALALATACGTTLDPYGDSDDVEPASDVVIDALEPEFGPIGGGTEVTITGEGFVGDVDVFFGSAKLDVEVVDDETLVVTTPNAGAPLAVDVTVRSDLGEDVLAGGFTFGDAPVTGNGKVGGLVELSRLQIACPECFFLSGEFALSAGAAFHEPVARSWLDWLPPLGQCARNPTSSAPVSAYQDKGAWAYLNFASTSIAMARTVGEHGPSFGADGFPVDDYVSNGSYDLVVPDAGLELTGALRAAEGFSDIQPIELISTSNYAFSAVLSRSGASVGWAPSGSGTFLVILDVYDPYGESFLGQVLCHTHDTGGFTVPGSMLSSFPSYSLAGVGLYRRVVTETELPDGSTLEGVATAGVLGTATLY